MKRGLITCQGKTPEATMASALYTDVKRKEATSIFIRPHEGLFGLREWAEQGIAFEVRAPLAPLLLFPSGASYVQAWHDNMLLAHCLTVPCTVLSGDPRCSASLSARRACCY